MSEPNRKNVVQFFSREQVNEKTRAFLGGASSQGVASAGGHQGGVETTAMPYPRESLDPTLLVEALVENTKAQALTASSHTLLANAISRLTDTIASLSPMDAQNIVHRIIPRSDNSGNWDVENIAGAWKDVETPDDEFSLG